MIKVDKILMIRKILLIRYKNVWLKLINNSIKAKVKRKEKGKA